MYLATGNCAGQWPWPDKKVALWPPVKSHCALTTLHFWMWSQTWKMVRSPEGMQWKQLLNFRDLLFLDIQMCLRHFVQNDTRNILLLYCKVSWPAGWDIFSREDQNWNSCCMNATCQNFSNFPSLDMGERRFQLRGAHLQPSGGLKQVKSYWHAVLLPSMYCKLS